MAKLSQYLTDNRTTQRDFAARLGTSASYLSEIAGGRKTPSLELAFAIERLTAGAVPAASWLAACDGADVAQEDEKGAA
ncbi:helix-turn-helix domain-containing protein [Cereibacter johrii]|uniref:helix-turn-helix domain-containing protein n=1 Tax=Cereibacter johrii TaxID=445629 RepID=UPI000A02F966